MEMNIKEQLAFDFGRFSDSRCLVHANKRTFPKDHKNVYHRHDFPQIWYCYQGAYQHNLEGHIYECTEGSLMVIPAGVGHDVRFPYGEAELLMLDVSYNGILETAPDKYINAVANLCLPAFSKELGYTFASCRMLSPASRQVVEEVFSWFVLANYAVSQFAKKEEIAEKLEQLFSTAECAMPEQYRKRAISIVQSWVYPAFKIIAYLNVHYPEKILEEDFLKEIGISHSSLNRYFKRVSGFSYGQYLLQLRVKRAYIYIRTTTYPLSYISDMCGFYDVYHMSHAFNKYIGERPKQRSMKLREFYGEKQKGK